MSVRHVASPAGTGSDTGRHHDQDVTVWSTTRATPVARTPITRAVSPSPRATLGTDWARIASMADQAPSRVAVAENGSRPKARLARGVTNYLQSSRKSKLSLRKLGGVSPLGNGRRASGRDLAFIIGGAHGLELDGVEHRLSLGSMTLPHQLARVVLLEALFRAHKIIAKQPYHY